VRGEEGDRWFHQAGATQLSLEKLLDGGSGLGPSGPHPLNGGGGGWAEWFLRAGATQLSPKTSG